MVIVCAWVAGIALPATAQQDETSGQSLYIESCASCHGRGGQGTENGPPVVDSGAAAVDFMLRTGRMPLADPEAQATRKEPTFDDEQIRELVAYVASLGEGPPIPEVDLSDPDLSLGQSLFVENCAACHGATGNGGAVGGAALAPSVHAAKPVEVAEAVVIGPGQMPVFGFTEDERNAIVSFVRFLQTAEDPGGAGLGQIGPVPEGFVAWALGVVTALVAAVFVARTRPFKRK